jgi:hypothetical protein
LYYAAWVLVMFEESVEPFYPATCQVARAASSRSPVHRKLEKPTGLANEVGGS